MHQRQVVIDKIVSMLTGMPGSPKPKEEDEKPAPANQPVVRVSMVGESSVRSKSEMQDERNMRVEIKLAVPRAAGFHAALNAISAMIENKIGAAPQLENTAESCQYIGMTADMGAVSDIDAASIVLIYEVMYIYTPTTAADAFLTANIKIDMASPRNDPQKPTQPDGQIDASATITLPA